MKTWHYVSEYGEALTLAFQRTCYAMNGRLAIAAWARREEDEFVEWERYCFITTNLWEPIDGEDCAWLDEGARDLCDWLMAQGCLSVVPRVAASGFNHYREGRFSLEFLDGCFTDSVDDEEGGSPRDGGQIVIDDADIERVYLLARESLDNQDGDEHGALERVRGRAVLEALHSLGLVGVDFLPTWRSPLPLRC